MPGDVDMGAPARPMALEMSVRLFLERAGVARLDPELWAAVSTAAKPWWPESTYAKAYLRRLLEHVQRSLPPDPPAPPRAPGPPPVMDKVPNREDGHAG